MKMFLAIFFVAAVAFANEEGGHEGGEHEEGHDGGHGSKATSVLPVTEYGETEAKISTLKTKIKADEDALRKLIEEKNHLPEKDPKLKEVVTQMSSTYKDWRGQVEELDKQQTLLNYKFPDHGTDQKRNYENKKSENSIESLADLEKRFSTEERLENTMKAAEKAYGAKPRHSKNAKTSEKPPAKSPEEETILLQK